MESQGSKTSHLMYMCMSSICQGSITPGVDSLAALQTDPLMANVLTRVFVASPIQKKSVARFPKAAALISAPPVTLGLVGIFEQSYESYIAS